MEKITGREAITVLAEIEAGYRSVNREELNYARKQANGFFNWLVEQGKSQQEAREICKALYDADYALITAEDPYADFTWSRGQEIGMAEIDSATANDQDYEGQADAACRSHNDYWENMEATADRFAGRISEDQWKYSINNMETVMQAIFALESQWESLGNLAQRKAAKYAKRINEMRFGKSPVLYYRHWAMCMNKLNDIRGNKKRYRISQPQEEEQKSEDILDIAESGIDLAVLEVAAI